MWWFGLMVWGVWDIVIFWFPGALGNCVFFFHRLLSKKGVSGYWTYIVLAQAYPLAPLWELTELPPVLCQRGSAGVGRTKRPCTKTPAGPIRHWDFVTLLGRMWYWSKRNVELNAAKWVLGLFLTPLRAKRRSVEVGRTKHPCTETPADRTDK